jgi:ADP-heptose:LPS heptosyltransferase
MALSLPTERDANAVIYVLRALGLGDLLTAVPALRALRRRFREAGLVLAAPSAYRELAMWTAAVDEVIPTSRLGEVNPDARAPRLAVNLHGSGPQSINHVLALRPEAVLTHRHPRHPQLDGPAWNPESHEVDRWCALLAWADIDCRADDLAIDRPTECPDHSGVVVLHPGAAAPARRWPAERFAVLAAGLRADGHDVVVTGSSGERELALAVAEAAGLPRTSVLAGNLNLLELVALVSDARLLVCGDTGVAHVATATGTPSVLLFGPTPPSRWGPRGDGRHVALWSGGHGDPHGATPDAGLLALSTAQVLTASRTALGLRA